MNEQQLLARIEELERENKLLKAQLSGRMNTAYQKIQAAVSARVAEIITRPDAPRFAKQALKRKIIEDVKWELRVRYANQFNESHLERALEMIREWKEAEAS